MHWHVELSLGYSSLSLFLMLCKLTVGSLDGHLLQAWSDASPAWFKLFLLVSSGRASVSKVTSIARPPWSSIFCADAASIRTHPSAQICHRAQTEGFLIAIVVLGYSMTPDFYRIKVSVFLVKVSNRAFRVICQSGGKPFGTRLMFAFQTRCRVNWPLPARICFVFAIAAIVCVKAHSCL